MTMTRKRKHLVIAALILLTVLATVSIFAVTALADEKPTISMADYNSKDATHATPVITGVDVEKDDYQIKWVHDGYQMAVMKNTTDLPAEINTWDHGTYTVVLEVKGKMPTSTTFKIADNREAISAEKLAQLDYQVDSDFVPDKKNVASSVYTGKEKNVHVWYNDGPYYMAPVAKDGTPITDPNYDVVDVGVYTFELTPDMWPAYEEYRLNDTITFTLTITPAENPVDLKLSENGDGSTYLAVSWSDNVYEALDEIVSVKENDLPEKAVESLKVSYSWDDGVTWSNQRSNLLPNASNDPYPFKYKISGNPNIKEKIIDVRLFVNQVVVWGSSSLDGAIVAEWNDKAVYTGKEVTFGAHVTLKSGYVINFDLIPENGTGTALNVGEYQYKLAIPSSINPNAPDYYNVRVMGNPAHTCTIDPAKIKITAYPSEITYGEAPVANGMQVYCSDIANPNDLLAALNLNGTVTFTYGGYEAGKDAGDYQLLPVFTLKDPTAEKQNVIVECVASALHVAKKEIKIEWLGQDAERVYTGELLALPTAQFKDVNGNVIALDLHTLTPFRDAGTYRFVAQIPEKIGEEPFATRDNYVLPTEFTALYTIKKAKIVLPTAPTVVYRYTGEEQTYGLEANSYYTVENNVRTEIGSQIVTVKIANPENFEWANGSFDELTFTFEIKKAVYDMSNVTFNDIAIRTGETYSVAVEGTLPTGFDGSTPSVSYTGMGNTEPGKYEVRATFATDSEYYEAPEDMVATLTIKWTEQRTVNNESEEKEEVKVTSENGIDPDIRLVVNTFEVTDKEQMKNVVESLQKSEDFGKRDRIFATYDVTLEKDNVKVQPDGTIYVYLTIPSKLKNSNFRILHIHEGVAKEIEYTNEDQYAVVKTDKLSEFAFVHKQTSLLVWIIILAVLVCIFALLLVAQLINAAGKGNLRVLLKGKALAAAPIFLMPGHLAAVITLGVILLILVSANLYLIISYAKNIGVDSLKEAISGIFAKKSALATANGAPAPAKKQFAKQANISANVAAAPKKVKKTEEEIWAEEASEFIANGGVADVQDDENGEPVTGVFFARRKYKIYYFQYNEELTAGEIAAYTNAEGKELKVIVAVPKVIREAAKLHLPLKTLHKVQ